MKNSSRPSGISGLVMFVMLLGACLSLSVPKTVLAALPAGFEVETIAGGLNYPAAMTFVNDGRIFVAEKAGAVRIIKNGALLTSPLIQLTDVNAYADRGLIGITIDPNFSTNGYLYLLYTYENTPGTNFAGTKTVRLVRVTVVGDAADESSKVVILGSVGGSFGTASCENFAITADCIPSDSPSHSGGALRFGPDGKLYVSLGDGAHFDYVDPRAQRAQNLDSLGGKILRINTDGTGVLTNPFANGTTTTNRSKIFSYGMRNAFRINFRPSNGALYAGDVGWNTWEEVNKIVAGGNYGWPCREGLGLTEGYNCDVSPRVDPLYTYGHNTSGAGAVVAGAFPTAYPIVFASSFFIGDYAQNWIKRVVVDANDNFVSVENFMDGVDGANGPVAIDRGPDGNIYFISIYTGELKRILYTTGNRQPIAQIVANPTNGLAPLTVNFSASGSSDPDGNPLTYAWAFGDGATSSLITVSHTYTANGTYAAVLNVTDGQGGLSTKSTTITVGNRAPSAVISSPASGSLYHVGESIQLTGMGTDPEDGSITTSNKLTWTIILHHNIHIHVLQTLTGTNPTFPGPDHSGAFDIYTEVQLTVTDSGGLTNTKSINLYLDNNPVNTGNLILNASLEDSVVGVPDSPQYWHHGGYGVNNSDYLYPVAGQDGAKAAQINIVNYTNGDVKWIHDPVSVSPSTLYTFIGYYKSNTIAELLVQNGSGDGTYTYDTLNAAVPAAANWTQLKYTFTTPASGKTATVALLLSRVGTLTIDNFSIVKGTSTPPVLDTTPPTVVISSPTGGSTISGTSTTLSATATDTSGIAEVKFLVDSAMVATDGIAPYSFAWNTTSVTDGMHIILAVASDAAGNVATSTPLSVQVQNQVATSSAQNLISNPSVEVNDGGTPAKPLNWQTGKWGTNIATFSYPVTGFDGANAMQLSVTSYSSGDAKWFFNEVPVNAGTPYQYSHYYKSTAISSIVAQYRLASGQFTYVTVAASVPTSTAWQKLNYTLTPPATATSVTVFHLLNRVGTLTTDLFSLIPPGGTVADTIPPTISITSPTAGATVSGTNTAISATASDANGIADVRFFIDASLVATKTVNPYTFVWDTTTANNGNHTLLSVARDTAGNAATSTPVNVTVQNGTTTSVSNIIANPSVETADPALATQPQNWFTDNWGTNSAVFTYPVLGFDGAKAMQVQMTAFTTGDAKWQFKAVAVTPGTTYQYSHYYKSTIPTSVVAEYTLTNGTVQYVDLAFGIPAAAAWTKVSYTLVPPANTATVSVLHIIESVGTVTTDNFTLTPPGGTVVDTIPPTVSLISPTGGQIASSSILLSAQASDTGGIAGVKFFIDNILRGSEDTTAPYELVFNFSSTTLANGSHTALAVARDNAGNVASSSPIFFTVQAATSTGTTTPTNLITNGTMETVNGADPANWTRGGSGNNTLTYSYPIIGQDGGKAAQVQISNYTNGTGEWTPTNAVPMQIGKEYTFSTWYKGTTISDIIGEYVLTDGTSHFFGVIKEIPPAANWTFITAKFTPPNVAVSFKPHHLMSTNGTLATDDVSLTITGNATSTNDITPPVVTLTSPLRGATVSGTVTVSATATDNLAVKNVFFAIDGTPVTPLLTTPPFTFNWNTTGYSDGTHTIKATATDPDGNNAATTTTVIVNNAVASTTNIITNPSLETADTTGGPLGWLQGKWGTNTTSFIYPVTGQDGAKAARVDMTAFSSGDAKWYFAPKTVTPGTLYTYSHYYQSNVPTNVTIWYTKTDGTNLYVDVASLPAAAVWTKYSTTLTVPAGVASMTVFHHISAVGSLSVDNYLLQ